MRKFVVALLVTSVGFLFAASSSGAGVAPPPPPGVPSGGFSLDQVVDCSTDAQFPPGTHYLSAKFTSTTDADDDVNVGQQVTYTYYVNSDSVFTGDYTITIELSNETTLDIAATAVTVGPAYANQPVGSVAYSVAAADAGELLTATVTAVSVLNTTPPPAPGSGETVTCAPPSGNTIALYVNKPPAPTDDTATTDAGVAVTTNVLANDGLTEDSATSIGNAQNGINQDDVAAAGPVTIVTQPTSGTCVPSGTDSITYTPEAAFSGSDGCTYRITDNDGAPGQATLAVEVAPPSPVLRSRIYVANKIASGPADYSFLFGAPTSQIIAGDWNGNGTDGFGSREGNVYTLVDERGIMFTIIGYGKPTDTTLVGDWDANGTDTLAARRGNVYYLKNSIAPGNADIVLGYGRADDEVFVGDWNGNDQDTFAVRRGNTFYVRNSTTSGNADIVFGYGKAGDEVLVGDWNQDGIDTFAVRRGKEIFIRNDFNPGPAQTVISFGKATDELIVGDWNGDGVDTFSVRRIEPQ